MTNQQTGERKMVHFTSIGGVYEVDCPGDTREGIEKYVNRFAAMFFELERLLAPLPPSFRTFNVSFQRVKKSKYTGKGRIVIHTHSAKGNPKDFGAKAENPECFGGLFHETVHGILDRYIRRPLGKNVHPVEALDLSVQWAAVKRINPKAANAFQLSRSEPSGIVEWFKALKDIQESSGGFAPIHALLAEMSRNAEPVFRNRRTFAEEVNKLWEDSGYSCRLPDGLPTDEISLGKNRPPDGDRENGE